MEHKRHTKHHTQKHDTTRKIKKMSNIDHIRNPALNYSIETCLFPNKKFGPKDIRFIHALL